MLLPHGRRRTQELGDPLAGVDDAEAADDDTRRDALGLDRRRRPRGMGDDADRTREPGRARAVVDVAGVDDEPGRVLEHEGRQREVRRAGLPERRDALVEDAVREQSADDAVLALHEIEVAVTVPAADGHARDEVVENEVVEDDDSGPLSKRRRRSTRGRPGCSRRGRGRRRYRAEHACGRGGRPRPRSARGGRAGEGRCSRRCPTAPAASG